MKPPPKNPGDTEVTFQMWKTFAYHTYRFRFTPICALRLNHKDDLRDSINYKQIDHIVVQSSEKYLQIHYTPGLQDPWTVYSESFVSIVQEIYQRKYDQSGGDEMPVIFEPGARRFEYIAAKKGTSYAQGVKASVGGVKGAAKSNIAMCNENDDFMDEIWDQLGTIENQSNATAAALATSTGLLETQDALIQTTAERTNQLNSREDGWLNKNKSWGASMIGGQGR